MIRKRALPALFLAATAVACAPWSEPPPALAELHGRSMGTSWTVKVVVADGLPPRDELGRLVQQRLDEVDAAMSTYKPTSELSRLNAFEDTTPFPLSSATLTVLALAREVSAASEGAFDVTVGPLVDAWGFGPPGRPPAPPSPARVTALRQHVGWRLLELDEAHGTARKVDPELRVDLSAIAKGYAVDRVADAVAATGAARFMVEVGGEVRAAGLALAGRPWRIGIERPDPSGRSLERVVPLHDLAMATSGDYRNYYEVDGRRLSHTIDPRIGAPIAHRVASVTVVDPSCARADAWATALMVLGPEGYALAERQALAVLAIERAPDGSFREVSSTGFRRLEAGAAPP